MFFRFDKMPAIRINTGRSGSFLLHDLEDVEFLQTVLGCSAAFQTGINTVVVFPI